MSATRPAAVRGVVAAWLVGLVSVALGLAPVAVPALAPARAATVAVLSVDVLEPGWLTPSSTVTVGGRLANISRQVLRDVELRLRVDPVPIGSRSELAEVADGASAGSRTGDVVLTENLADLQPGETVTFDLRQAVSELPLATDSFGLHVVAVEVLASRRSGFGRVALTRTVLPIMQAEGSVTPTSFSWVWPLVARPTRLADGTFADNSLATDVGPDGRLTRLLAAGARLAAAGGLTWAVDPELVAAVQDMADGYVVLNSEDDLSADQAAAVAFLDALRAATAGGDVVALPHGDADVNAAVRAGLGTQVATSLGEARATIAAALPEAIVLTSVAWPPQGFLSRPALRAVTAVGMDSVVLDARAVRDNEGPSTLTGLAGVRAGKTRATALLADARLADLLARSARGTPLLEAQRLLAETAMITAELPSGPSRSVVVTPPRRWSPDQSMLDRLVDVATTAPWLQPVSLPVLAATPPEGERLSLRYPRTARERELPASYLTAVADMEGGVELFRQILSEPTAYVDGLERSLRLLTSSWWRGRDGRTNRLARERAWLADRRGDVRVKPGNFTFSSRSGTLALTVVNDLDQQVEVVLQLEPQNRRLQLDPVEPLQVGAGSKRQVEVNAQAVAAGTVFVRAQLRTPAGREYGQPVQLQIRITEYGTVALYITLSAAALLFLTAGVQVVRRVVRARRTG